MTANRYSRTMREVARERDLRSRLMIAEVPSWAITLDMTEDELRTALTFLCGYAPELGLKALEYAGGVR